MYRFIQEEKHDQCKCSVSNTPPTLPGDGESKVAHFSYQYQKAGQDFVRLMEEVPVEILIVMDGRMVYANRHLLEISGIR